MAKQTSGILGTVTGKISNVVGATWKGIPYFRGHVIPANPNSEGQQAQREKFTKLVPFAKTILATVIWKFWDPFQKKMSGFNAFVAANAKAMVSGFDWLLALVSQGNLEGLITITPVYDPVSGNVTFSWTSALSSNGLDADKMVLVAYDTVNNVAAVSDAAVTRGDDTDDLGIGAGRTATDIFAACFCYRGSGDTLIVSNSIADMCEEV